MPTARTRDTALHPLSFCSFIGSVICFRKSVNPNAQLSFLMHLPGMHNVVNPSVEIRGSCSVSFPGVPLSQQLSGCTRRPSLTFQTAASHVSSLMQYEKHIADDAAPIALMGKSPTPTSMTLLRKTSGFITSSEPQRDPPHANLSHVDSSE